MDAAQIITIADVAAGFGLSSSYSSVAAAETMAADLAVSEAVAVVTTMVVNGLLFFLFSSAAAETMVPAANFLTGARFEAPSYINNQKF